MKKVMGFKKVLCLLAAIVMLLSVMTVSVSAGSASEAKNSVVVVIRADLAGQGTGFAIGRVGKPVEYIVTNNHVVRGDLGFTTATVVFDLASNEMMTANVYYYDAEKDIAVLKLPQATEKRAAMTLCPMEYVDPDDTFVALGYPTNAPTDWPKFNKDDITVTKGGIKKLDRIMGLDVYMLDLVITHGNSGGPLVNSKGEVVGINTFGVAGENYAIAIDELLKVIDTDRIPVTLHGDINWYLIAGAAILLLIIVLVIVLLVNKSRTSANAYADPAAMGSSAAAVTMPGDPAANNPAPAKAGARVIAISGTLNGKRYEVTGAIKIGRDASKCGIDFPVNTQGVSAVHCEVAFDGSVCYVKDLGSSYGTYMIDGTKLTANAPQILKSGDKFYLASPANTFEVRF